MIQKGNMVQKRYNEKYNKIKDAEVTKAFVVTFLLLLFSPSAG